MYANGEGVSKDYDEAIRWYRMAADQGKFGEYLAQIRLGLLYEQGKDLVSAYMWYNLAAANGSDIGKKNREEIERTMTPQQISEAQRLTREWRPITRNPYRASTSNLGGTTFDVRLRRQGGVYIVPVLINDKIRLDFVIDSGAAEVSVPADVVLTLMRTGTLTPSDFTGTNIYTLADGSKIPSQTFRIRSLKVGDRVLENVSGNVASVNGSLLLGQSFLSRFKSWSVDNTRQVLVLGGVP